jgi:MFS family permease
VVSLLNDFSSEIVFPLLPLFFTTVLGGSRAGLGMMEGLVDSVASLVKLWSGRVGDRLPRRKPLVLTGYSLASLSRPLIALALAPWQVVALRVVDRIGKGMRGAPRDALIADSVAPAIRGRAFGFHRSMDHLGAIAGPVTALVLIPLLFGARPLKGPDFRLLFLLAAIPALLSLAVLALQVREAPRLVEKQEERGPETRLGRSFWQVLGVVGLFTLGNSSDGFLLLRTYDFGMTLRDSYLIWVLLHVVKSALSTPAGALSDRVPRRWLIAGGWGVYALVYLGFGCASAAWQVWALFGAYGLYFGLAEGAERALVADLVPREVRGTAFGWYNAAIGITALPAGFVFGKLWDWRGPGAAFGFGAALALLAAVLLLLLPSRPVRELEG